MDKSLTERQIIMTYLLITISSVIRDIPNIAAKKAGNYSYIAAGISFVILLALIFIIGNLIRKHKGRNIYDIIETAAGRVVAKTVISVYAVWALISASAYMQYYVQRFNSTIMPYTSREFFIGVMLILAFFAFRKNVKTICRISEICFPITAIILGGLIILSLTVINKDNLVIENIKAMPLVSTGTDIAAVGGYLVLTLFFSDRLSENREFGKTAFYGVVYFTLLTVVVILVTIGINGAELTAKLPLPFFTTVKQISSFGIVERVEPLLISIWLISDFVVISIFTAVFLLCIKWLLGLEKVSFLMIPVLAIIYYFTKIFAGSQFELEYYTIHIMPALNIVFQYIIPVGLLLLPIRKNPQA